MNKDEWEDYVRMLEEDRLVKQFDQKVAFFFAGFSAGVIFTAICVKLFWSEV